MTRINRSLISAMAVIFFAWTGGCARTYQSAGRPETPRNVVLLLFDDLRHDPFSFADGPVQTPHIDSLARAGIVFHSAMTTTGLCSPSRAALFAGRWGHSNGLEDNTALWHTRATGLDPDQSTVIEWAVDQEY